MQYTTSEQSTVGLIPSNESRQWLVSVFFVCQCRLTTSRSLLVFWLLNRGILRLCLSTKPVADTLLYTLSCRWVYSRRCCRRSAARHVVSDCDALAGACGHNTRQNHSCIVSCIASDDHGVLHSHTRHASWRTATVVIVESRCVVVSKMWIV